MLGSMEQSRQRSAPAVLQRGTNNAQVGTLNRALVLDVVQRQGPVTRAAVAAATGLTAQTVSNIAARLLAQGLVREDRVLASDPHRVLRIAADARYAVGLHLDPARVVAVLVDLAGVVRATEHVDTGPLSSPTEIVDAMVAVTERLVATPVGEHVAAAPTVRDRLLGIGIAAPGPLDPTHRTLAAPVQLPGWGGLPLADEVRRRTGMPVLLEKDGVAAGLGEAWTTMNTTGLVSVTLGHGISAAVVTGGAVVRGSTGNAGEFGGMPVQAHGRWTAVWEACQPLQQVERAIDVGVLPPGTTLDRPAAVRVAYEALCASDAGRSLVAAGGTALGTALAHVVELLDVTDVVIGGSAAIAGGTVFLDAVRAGLAGRLPGGSHVVVEPTVHGEAAVARGAACAVLATALDADPTAPAVAAPANVPSARVRSPRARSIAHPW